MCRQAVVRSALRRLISCSLNRPSFCILPRHSAFSFVVRNAASTTRACEDRLIGWTLSARHALFRAQSFDRRTLWSELRGRRHCSHAHYRARPKAVAGKISCSPASLAWLNVAPFRDLHKQRLPSQAVAAEVENRNSVLSRHIAYMMTASFRATAVTAFLCPLRCAIRSPHAFKLDQPLNRVSKLFAAS